MEKEDMGYLSAHIFLLLPEKEDMLVYANSVMF